MGLILEVTTGSIRWDCGKKPGQGRKPCVSGQIPCAGTWEMAHSTSEDVLLRRKMVVVTHQLAFLTGKWSPAPWHYRPPAHCAATAGVQGTF
jgi:hypothetical protein